MKEKKLTQSNGEQPSPPAADSFLTKTEIAQRLRKTPRTIEHWTRAGMLPVLKIGRSCLYDWPQVQAALRDRFTFNGGAK